MHPQPQLGLAPHVHLEHVGAALRELAHRVGGARRRRFDRVLVDQAEAAVRQRHGEDRHHRRAGAQRERRQRRGRRRGPLEEAAPRWRRGCACADR